MRPYAQKFLKSMSKKYELILFTASQKSYADAVLEEIDPKSKKKASNFLGNVDFWNFSTSRDAQTALNYT